MPNSPFKRLPKAADGTGLSAGLSGASSDEGMGAGGPGEGVEPGGRKSALKRGGLEQGVPKIARVQTQSVGSVDASAGLGVTAAVTGNGSVPSIFSERMNQAAISLPVGSQDLSVDEADGLGSAASSEKTDSSARVVNVFLPESASGQNDRIRTGEGRSFI